MNKTKKIMITFEIPDIFSEIGMEKIETEMRVQIEDISYKSWTFTSETISDDFPMPNDEKFIKFKNDLINKSNEITTSFHMDQSNDEQFEQYYDEFIEGHSLEDIIWKAVDEAYDDKY